MGSSEKKMQKSYFDVLGICCSSEVPLIEKILKPLDGVKDVSVIVPSRTVIVVHDTLLISQVQIVKALNQARLEANVRAYGEGNYKKKWPSPFAVACGILLLLSFLKYIYLPFKWLALGAVIVGIYPIVLKGAAAIRNFTLDINILVIIAVAGSIVLKDYWEAGTIVFLFTIAEWLESRASHKATAVMSSLVNIVPQKAVIAESGEEVNADEVMVNTILSVKAGEVIPVDGIIVEGKCEVDERTLTGESFPVPKQMESTVWAGTINLNGYISIKTTALAEDCVVARMAKLVEEAQNNKSKTQRFIDRCAKYYTPAIVAIATCIAVVPAALRVHNQSKWFHLALVVLVSGCPCALILSTPVATFCALSKAATSGLLVKGAEYLETLAKIKIMAFDKTGTITRGEFVVTDFQSLLDGFNLETLLYWVASIESKSSHPMAAALIGFAQSHSVDPKPDKVDEFLNFPGEGIYGRIDGKDIYVGNRKIVARAGCATVPTLEGDAKEGKSIGYIFSGSSPAGIFCLSDVCRTGVKEAIKDLKSMGIKTAMLTGDCQAAAKHAQDQLGGALEEVHAELLPEDKARIIKEFQKLSPTAMIGDGLNDAAALATADIGISMGISGSALAMETGQVILMSNDIRKIPKAVKLARRTRRKIIENMILSVSTKAGIIALAIAGHPLVWAAVLADVGTCLLVIFNSMLLLRGAPRHGRKSSATPHVHKQCCTPVAPHVHEHGGKHSSHSHRSCCSSTKAEKKCGIQKCTGEKKCGTQKCADAKKCGTKKCMDEKRCGTQNCVNEKKCGTQKNEKKCGTQKCADEKKCGTPKCSHNQIQQTECRDHGSHGEHKSHVNPKCSHNQVEQTEYRNHGSHGEHKTHVSHSSHAHKHCGSDTKAEKKCAMSVLKEKAQECCVNDDQHQQANHHDHGNCKMDKHDIESHGIHKHGSHGVTKRHDSHSSHSHKHCCSGTKAEKQFAMSILEEMVEECCVHNDQLQEAKHHDHENCEKDTHDMESHGEHKLGCGVHSSQTHNECVGGDEIHEVKHCGHNLGNNHHSSHFKNEHVITEEALGDVVKSCCNPPSLGAHSGCNSQVECEAIKASMSWENRHIGGCCESFRKECCGHDPHFGVGFKGGLSEIVIE